MRRSAITFCIAFSMLCGCSMTRTRMYNFYNNAERATGKAITGATHLAVEGVVNGLDDDFFDE